MKRIIVLLVIICMLFSFVPASFAAMRFDAIEAAAGEIEYINRCNYLSVGATSPIAGIVNAEFKMKIINGGGNKYSDFRLQLLNSQSAAIVELVFTPQYTEGQETKTKIDPDAKNFEYDVLSVEEWITVYLTANTDTQKFDLSIKYSDGTVESIYSQRAFKSTGVDVAQIRFAFNRSTNQNYTGGALFKEISLFKMEEIEEVEGENENSPITGEVEVGGSYTFPETVTVKLAGNSEMEVPVTWNGTESFNTLSAQDWNFTGIVKDDEDNEYTVHLKVKVKPLSIIECNDVDVYLERYDDSMPKYVKVKYSNNSYGYEEVEWNPVDRTATEKQVITGTVEGYEENVMANVYIYEANETLFEEDAQDYDNGMHIRGQYLSPLPRENDEDYWGWNFSVPETVLAKPNPLDENNMAISFPVTDSYGVIDLEKGKNGNAVISYDVYFPEGVTDFRNIVTSLNAASVIEFSFDASTGTITRIGGGYSEANLFESGKWFNIKYISDLNTDTYDLFINNIKIKDDLAMKTSTEDDISTIRFRNNSASECEIYVDNIKMYHLSDMLNASYEEVKLTEENVTGSLCFNSPTDTSITATWVSDDTTLIGNDGTVYPPAWKSGDKNTKVTLTLSKDIGAGYKAEKQATFDLVVKEAPPTDAEAVANTLNSLTFDAIKNENTDETNILTDLTLPAVGEHDTVISWSSEPSGYIDSQGKIYTPESSDVSVTLTATVSKGSVTETKTLPPVTVKYQAELSDLQAVRKAALTLSIPSSASSDMVLPTSGANGVSITWTSNNLSALSNSGEYKKPSTAQSVTMTAILTKGTSAREEKKFTVQVAAFSGGGGGDGGSGGSGGSKGAMIAPTVTPVTEPEKITPIYSDIKGYDWAETAIYTLTNDGVLTGTGDGKFEPARNVKREEFVAMAVRAFNITDDENVLPFTDVLETDWHYETTKRAYAFGLVSGISESSFGSGMEIRRQDMFVIMYNAAKKLGISLKKVREVVEFIDCNNISEYALEAVSALYEAGIVNGYGDSINPLQSATRAEAAKMIYELMNLK